MASERALIQESLWDGVLALVTTLPVPREASGTSRSRGSYRKKGDTHALTVAYLIDMPDGSRKKYDITVMVVETVANQDDSPMEEVKNDGD